MITDYEDDAHFCLKCHTTIIGLENYVNHRKTGCSKTLSDPSKSPLPSQLLPHVESFNLKADDFFSSLELRSSSKKQENQSTSGKNFSGILTRSKTTAVIQASSSSNKEVPEQQQSKSGKHVWIGGHQLKELGHGDNQSKLIKAVDNLERRKEEPARLELYDESEEDSDDYEYDVDDTSSDDQDTPPRNHTGGKWKPISPIQWSKNIEYREWNIPPPSHTGGKWKPHPRHPTSPSITNSKGRWKPDLTSKEDDNIPPPTFTGSKWVASKKQDIQTVPPPGYSKGKWKPKDVQEDDVPPVGYTKGKWKPRDLSDDIPPPFYSKGKWKPKSDMEHESITYSQSKEKSKLELEDDYPPPSHTKGKWKPKSGEEGMHAPNKTQNDDDNSYSKEQTFPPPSYTKGKWKPVTEHLSSEHTKGKIKPKFFGIINEEADGSSSKQKYNMSTKVLNKSSTKLLHVNKSPSENYTEGKWLPSPSKKEQSLLRKTSGTIKYWCSPCNRTLASKIVYERHLKSELHFKRTLHDREFDDSEEINFLKSIRRPKPKPPESIFSHQEAPKESYPKRNRKRKFMKCEVCQSKVNKDLIGKHLISHYHCRKGDITSAAARRLVLENIHEIVLEHPFQCSICKFYCNTHDYFLRHWLSTDHKERNKQLPGYFFCIMCKFQAKNTEEMYNHLISSEHNEVVSVINRSVPIIIKKINPTKCATCEKEFTLKIQLLKHCEKLKHDDEYLKEFKMKFVCCTCEKPFLSNVALKRHFEKAHKKKYFICTPCDLTFENMMQAKLHRRTQKHKYNSSSDKPTETNKKKCKHCGEFFNNFLLLKGHLAEKHPEEKIRCPHCGMSFIIAQELTTHLRLKQCKFEENTENSFKCEQCPFSSNSSSELLFHKALHSEPLFFEEDTKDSKLKPIPRYKCPICDKIFPKVSLLGHIRQHTQERPYTCNICGKNFARKNNLQYHVKNHGANRSIRVSKKTVSNEKPFLCSTCGSSFAKRFLLQQHMLIHLGKEFKCTEEGCIYSARTRGELQNHMNTHSDQRTFQCSECEYKGKTKLQLTSHMMVHNKERKHQCPQCSFTGRSTTDLKRHTRIHTGAKPYSCPHCEFKCNNLENLRKHILSTKKHPGKSIYECKLCNFTSNFAKDFKAHMVVDHESRMENANSTSLVAGLYEIHGDQTFLNLVVEEDEQVDEQVDDLEKASPAIETTPENVFKIIDTDPVVCQIPTGFQTTSKEQHLDQMLPMFIIPKEDCTIENLPDSWNLVGRYDVEEHSGTLIPFENDDNESLFQEHF